MVVFEVLPRRNDWRHFAHDWYKLLCYVTFFSQSNAYWIFNEFWNSIKFKFKICWRFFLKESGYFFATDYEIYMRRNEWRHFADDDWLILHSSQSLWKTMTSFLPPQPRASETTKYPDNLRKKHQQMCEFSNKTRHNKF